MLLQPITVQFSKSTLKPSVYTLTKEYLTKNCEFTMSWLFAEVILGGKRYFKRNLGSPVKSCPRVSLIS